ncbi:MAG TPA: SpoIVB peptidase [Oscillospiraceae bacterium]|nr:SpoIVB peptidase [Oscillospiraceae bacterium]HPS33665.1 SpoIVB peptidase [Oscillospiraceae bacterium]
MKNSNAKKIIRKLAGAAGLAVFALICVICYCTGSYPDVFYITAGGSPFSDGRLALKTDTAVTALAAGSGYKAELMFGIVPVKSVDVRIVDDDAVVAVGDAFGIRLKTEGVVVVSVGENGAETPASKSGLLPGDSILEIDSKKPADAKELARIIENCSGKKLRLKVLRDGKTLEMTLVPEKAEDGKYRSGMWVRDSGAGIGTMTFYRPADGIYAGLGHAISDFESGKVLPISGGEIASAKITGIVKGEAGTPGELVGTILNDTIGSLEKNSSYGVYGKLYDRPDGEAVKVAMRQEIETGRATIITAVDEKGPQQFEINIIKIDMGEKAEGRNLIIEVTDPKLLELTGGIVQGMSGSPILQNGKLIGAVTHVFVNNPTRGYGLFADTMLAETEALAKRPAA